MKTDLSPNNPAKKVKKKKKNFGKASFTEVNANSEISMSGVEK